MRKKLLAMLLIAAMLISGFTGVTVPDVYAEEVVDLTEDVLPEEPSQQEQTGRAAAVELSGEITGELTAGEYILTGNAYAASTISISGTVTIDLNGKTLTAPAGKRCFAGANYTQLIIDDSVGTGKIVGNGTYEGHGAFMDVPYRGGVTVNGGTITGFTASGNGGVFFMNGNRTLTINGGTFSNNKAQSGAIIKTDGCKVVINDGLFTGNIVTSGGSLVHSNNIDMEIHGGTFTANQGPYVVLVANGPFVMDGGRIEGNAGKSAVIHLNNYNGPCSAVFSGTAVVGDNGIALAKPRTATVGGVEVTWGASTATVCSLRPGADLYAQEALTISEDDISVCEEALENGYYRYSCNGAEQLHKDWTPVSGTLTELPAGNYYLDGTTYINSKITLKGDVRLCLNSNTLTGTAAQFFRIENGASLTVCDHGYGGKIVGTGDTAVTGSGAFAQVNGTFTLESGIITDFHTDGYGAVFYMPVATGVVKLNGGTITGNRAANGAVFYAALGTVNIGGTVHITENTTPGSGAVMISYGNRTEPVVNITGGTIDRNVAEVGGLFHLNGSKLTISGGTITQNGSSGTLYLQAVDMIISGGVIKENYKANMVTPIPNEILLTNHYGTHVHSTGVITGDAVIYGGKVNLTGHEGYEPNTCVVENLSETAYVEIGTDLPCGDNVRKFKNGDKYAYTSKEDNGSLKVLVLGNEAAWDSVAYLSQLALLTGNRMQVGLLSMDDASIRDHAYHMSVGTNYDYYVTNADTGEVSKFGTMTAEGAAAMEDWDFVILHQQLWAAGYPTVHNEDLQYLMDCFAHLTPEAEVYYNMGWAVEEDCTDKNNYLENYGSQAAMYNAIVRVLEEAIVGEDSRYGEGLDGYIPVGAAIQRGRENGLSMTRDKMNLSYEAGRLAAAMTVLKTLLPEADLNDITVSGLADILSETDVLTGEKSVDPYENNEAALTAIRDAVAGAYADATAGDLLPELLEQEPWQKNEAEGVITAVQTVAPMKLHFGDVAIGQDGTVYLTAYESVQHAVTRGEGEMQQGPGRCYVWKGTADGLTFDTENPLLVVDEPAIEAWGLMPDLFNRYELLKSGSIKARTAIVIADPRDPNIVMAYTDVDGDGQKEELLIFTTWVSYLVNSGSPYRNVLYLMHSADGGQTWTQPQVVTGPNGGYAGPKRGDITYFEDGQILVPCYGGGATGIRMEWNVEEQVWVPVASAAVPDTAPEETANGASHNEVSFISPDGGDTVYCFTRISGAVLKSEDRGETWVEIANEPGPAQQPGFARLDDNTVFVTWSNSPNPRSTYGKVFHVDGHWMDTPTRMIYTSGVRERHDAGDPSCATMKDGKVYVISYDVAYRSIVANIVDPNAVEYGSYELDGSLKTVTMEEAETGNGTVLNGQKVLELGTAMERAHTVRAAVRFTSSAGKVVLKTRNGEVTVTPASVTAEGCGQTALNLALNTDTYVTVSMVGDETYGKVWQGEEPEGWTFSGISEAETDGLTVVTGSGVTVTEAKVTCQAEEFSLQERAEVKAMVAGATLRYAATPLQDEIVWSSDDPCIARVVNGQLIGNSAGTTKIHMKVGREVLSCDVTVTAQPNEIFGAYGREEIFFDDMNGYAVGKDALTKDAGAAGIYRLVPDDQGVNCRYDIVQEKDGNRYLEMAGYTSLYLKEYFYTECTAQFDFRFNSSDDTVYLSMWNDTVGTTCVIHLSSEGLRFHYRPKDTTVDRDSVTNPDTYEPLTGRVVPINGAIGRSAWKTIKIARTDGGCYIKVWDRGQPEPKSWDMALYLDYLKASAGGNFRMTFAAVVGTNTFDVDNLTITRNNGNIEGDVNEQIHTFTAEVAEEKYLATPATTEAAATYYKSCLYCGAAGKETFSYGSPLVTLFGGIKTRMDLGNALDMQFGVPKSAMSDWTGTYAVLTKTASDGTTKETVVPQKDWGTAGSMYVVIFKGIAAKQMGENVTLQIFNAEDQAISEPITKSVKQYALEAFAQGNANDKALYIDMLYYGAAAQVNFGYDVENLVTNGLTEAQKAYATETVEVTNRQVKGKNFLGSRLILESSIRFEFGFKGVDQTCYAVYSFTDHNGKAKTGTIGGEQFFSMGKGTWGIPFTAQVVADARNVVTLTVYSADGVELGSVTDSLESVVARGATDLFTAIMKFADSAHTSFHD